MEAAPRSPVDQPVLDGPMIAFIAARSDERLHSDIGQLATAFPLEDTQNQLRLVASLQLRFHPDPLPRAVQLGGRGASAPDHPVQQPLTPNATGHRNRISGKHRPSASDGGYLGRYGRPVGRRSRLCRRIRQAVRHQTGNPGPRRNRACSPGTHEAACLRHSGRHWRYRVPGGVGHDRLTMTKNGA